MDWNLKNNKEFVVVPLKHFDKTDHEETLQKLIKQHISLNVYRDIEMTYLEAMWELGHTNIKVSTNLVEPHTYRFAGEYVEIIPET